jgi:RNA-binding protein YlmH
VADAAELQDIELFRTERVNIQLSGERLDAAVAKVFSLSRDDAQALFRRGLVFASGKEIESVSYVPKPDEVISVRGFGRFIYRGPFGTSKKGKLNVAVDKYV